MLVLGRCRSGKGEHGRQIEGGLWAEPAREPAEEGARRTERAVVAVAGVLHEDATESEASAGVQGSLRRRIPIDKHAEDRQKKCSVTWSSRRSTVERSTSIGCAGHPGD